MGTVGQSLLDTLVLVSLAIILACLFAGLGGFVRYVTRVPSSKISVYWLMRLGMFVGVPFSVVGLIAGYMTGMSRVGAVSAIVPAGLTLVGGVAAYLFTKGGKAAVMASFAVFNFSVLMLIGAMIGSRERALTEDFLHSYEQQEAEINKEFRLRQYRRGLGMDDLPRKGAKQEPKDD